MFKNNKKHNQQSLFESTQWMNKRIREKLEKSWAPIFYEYVFRKIDEEPFSVLYSDIGRPNFPVNILLSLEYIKHMKDANDLELLDDFYFDYLVNYAVGIRVLGESNLAERTLYYFRERVYVYCVDHPDGEDLLFGQFIGLLKGFASKAGITMAEQRTDTTLFMSNIKKAGRMSLAYDVLAKGIKAIPEDMMTGSLSDVLKPTFKTDALYRSKGNEWDSKLTVILNLCKETLQILEGIPYKQNSDETRILKRFISEQTITEPSTGKLASKPNKEISPDSLQSAYDEDATYRRKGNEGHSGYALEISETCGKENPFQLITDYAVRPNITGDAEILTERIGTIRENTGCTDMYVDGGFNSPDLNNAAEENSIEIHRTNMSGREPGKKLPVTEFDIDGSTNTINKCPGGHTPVRAWIGNTNSSAHFSHEACSGCELRGLCYSKQQKKNCVVHIPLKSIETGRERDKMKTEQIENTSKRAGIEGSNSALKRKGQDKLDVCGIIKSTFVSGFNVTAQNIKRFIKFMQGGYKPKKTLAPDIGITVPVFG